MSAAAELQFTLTFKVTYCCHAECGTPVVMPTAVYNRFLNDSKQWFYCPFGHRQHFTGKSEAEKLQEALELEKKRTAAEAERSEWWRRKAEQNARSASAYKGQVTHIKGRVKHGVCPCCNRTFQNLQRHMHTKHPDYGGPNEQAADAG